MHQKVAVRAIVLHHSIVRTTTVDTHHTAVLAIVHSALDSTEQRGLTAQAMYRVAMPLREVSVLQALAVLAKVWSVAATEALVHHTIRVVAVTIMTVAAISSVAVTTTTVAVAISSAAVTTTTVAVTSLVAATAAVLQQKVRARTSTQ